MQIYHNYSRFADFFITQDNCPRLICLWCFETIVHTVKTRYSSGRIISFTNRHFIHSGPLMEARIFLLLISNFLHIVDFITIPKTGLPFSK